VEMIDAPSYSAVRAHLATLERKGHVSHTGEGTRYVYAAVHPKPEAGRAALKRAVQTFYHGSLEDAVAALLDTSEAPLSPEKIARLQALIDDAKKAGG
jgi:BlaI family transcriptional regulator, penicillinase repressor